MVSVEKKESKEPYSAESVDTLSNSRLATWNGEREYLYIVLTYGIQLHELENKSVF